MINMKVIITVVGIDKVGIIAKVSAVLAEHRINILDISQTIMDNMFTMIMLADTSECAECFSSVADKLDRIGAEMDLSIRIQREDVFNSMHRI